MGESEALEEVTALQVEILGALEKLGSFPHEIAESLKDLEVKGYRNTASACPISNYLMALTDCNVTTGRKFLTAIDFAEMRAATVDTPLPVREFIHFFDGGQYPELETPGGFH